jgi:hypothetical protein
LKHHASTERLRERVIMHVLDGLVDDTNELR